MMIAIGILDRNCLTLIFLSNSPRALNSGKLREALTWNLEWIQTRILPPARSTSSTVLNKRTTTRDIAELTTSLPARRYSNNLTTVYSVLSDIDWSSIHYSQHPWYWRNLCFTVVLCLTLSCDCLAAGYCVNGVTRSACSDCDRY